ncbi:MAG: HAD family hydrolase [Actinomycetota bacterium]
MTTPEHATPASVPVRLIATDLDGTLLGADSTVSARSRRALNAACAAGIVVVPVTARQPIGLQQIAAGAGFQDWAICGNGAFAIHLGTRELLYQRAVAVEAQRALATALVARISGLLFASVRDAGETFVAQHGYAEIARLIDHKRPPESMGGVTRDEVLAEPSLKLVIRHPELTPGEILTHIAQLDLPGFESTLSGAPFVEVMDAGVTKAWGLEQLCGHLGIGAHEVIAFGDAPNDLEMLRWAGRGIAMGNADTLVQDAADEVGPPHTDDGVARVIERLLTANAA